CRPLARHSAPRTERVARCVLAGLADPDADLVLGERPTELEVSDDAGAVDEKGARKAQHAEATGRLPVAVEDRHQPIEGKLVEERADLVAGLLQVDLQDDDIGLGRGDALQRGHLLAAGLAPGGPEVHDDDFAPVVGDPDGLAPWQDVREVGLRRHDGNGYALDFDLITSTPGV